MSVGVSIPGRWRPGFITKFRKGRNCDRDGAPHSNVGEAFGESRGEAGERHHGGAGGDQLGVVCAADERREGRRG